MIGIDAVDIERLRGTFERIPTIERRLFTDVERGYCWAKADPLLHFAGTLAAKEAVIKAVGLGTLLAWSRRIEVDRAPDGAPHARIRGAAHSPIHLSISHDGPVAVAVAISGRQLARDFHENRLLIDDKAYPGHAESPLRPNIQLLRFIGLGHRNHDPHNLAVNALLEATDLAQGTDFP